MAWIGLVRPRPDREDRPITDPITRFDHAITGHDTHCTISEPTILYVLTYCSSVAENKTMTIRQLSRRCMSLRERSTRWDHCFTTVEARQCNGAHDDGTHRTPRAVGSNQSGRSNVS
jgi:hypothetical protein